MALHFNLKNLFVLCFMLFVWRLILPYTLIWGIVLSVFILLMKYKKGVYKTDKANLMVELAPDGIFLSALLFNLWYVLNSWENIRQYDYFNFWMHADYFLQNDFFLKSPQAYLQSVFFQPPLWGLILAVITKFVTLFGYSPEESFCFTRFVSFFCIGGIAIIFWRFMVYLKFNDNMKIELFALFCFFPIHGIAANLVNNDAITYFLMFAMIYCGYLWYLDGSYKKAFILFGLLFMAGMIKFSALMVLPVLGIFGLFRLLNAQNKLSAKLWWQFGLIGFGAMLSFAWGIFLLYFDFPLVPPPKDNVYQDLSQYGIFERLFSLAKVNEVFADVYQGRTEPNVWFALIKTALFGEWSWQGQFWAWLLYLLGIGLALVLFLSFGSLLVYKLGKDWALNIAFVILVFAVIISWMMFWLEYPFFCSSEYRYVMILLPVSLLWFGNYITKKHLPIWTNYVMAGAIVLMILARFMLYLNTI